MQNQLARVESASGTKYLLAATDADSDQDVLDNAASFYETQFVEVLCRTNIG